MQHVARYDSEGLLFLLIGLLGSAAPNENHIALANCLGQGNNVITTNFDLLIEIACARYAVSYERVLAGSNDHSSYGTLLKVHGSIDSPESIAHTLDRVNRGLSLELASCFEACLEEKILLVIGYSGLDQLDIIPALRAAKYRECFWIWHAGKNRALRQMSSSKAPILDLPRIQHYKGPTRSIIRCLKLSGNFAQPEKSEERQHRITASILMHENRYAESASLIERNDLRGDLFFDLVHFEAHGSVSERTEDWRRGRTRLLNRLIRTTENGDLRFVGFLAKWVKNDEHLDRVSKLVADRVRKRSDAGDVVYEASVEIVYELIWRRRYAEASSQLRRLIPRLEKHGYGLLKSRALIEQCYLCHERFCNVASRGTFLSRGKSAAEEAEYLLGSDLYNDLFFYNQAILNKANIVRWMGDVEEALRLYDRAESYFTGVSVNNCIFVEYERAVLAYHLSDDDEALARLEAVDRLNREYGRKLWLGFTSRLRSLIALSSEGGSGDMRSQVIRLLKSSAAAFRRDSNVNEESLSRLLITEARTLRPTQRKPNKRIQPTLYGLSRRQLSWRRDRPRVADP